jgi:hypothetical protein
VQKKPRPRKKTTKPAVQRFTGSDCEDRGGILIRGFWAHATDAIIGVQVTDTGVKSSRSHDPHKVLAQQEHEKRKKYFDACLKQCKHFIPFVVSMDGLLGREAAELLK